MPRTPLDAARDAVIAMQAQVIKVLAGQAADLAARVERLERAASRNSGNPSMPPSADDLPGRTPPPAQAKRGGAARAEIVPIHRARRAARKALRIAAYGIRWDNCVTPSREGRPAWWETGIMFERKIEYDAAYIGQFPTFENDMGPAFRWAAERANQIGCDITVVAPSKRHFKDSSRLSEVPPPAQATPRTLGPATARTGGSR